LQNFLKNESKTPISTPAFNKKSLKAGVDIGVFKTKNSYAA
jgi:hypothetical protein